MRAATPSTINTARIAPKDIYITSNTVPYSPIYSLQLPHKKPTAVHFKHFLLTYCSMSNYTANPNFKIPTQINFMYAQELNAVSRFVQLYTLPIVWKIAKMVSYYSLYYIQASVQKQSRL